MTGHYGSRVSPKPVSRIVVSTASEHPGEVSTARELRALLGVHDLSGLQWTSQVVINRHGVAGHDPVLVLRTTGQGDLLLAAYVHQQLQGWADARKGFKAAIAETQQVWATVPTGYGGGATTQALTRTQLIVCHLERRAMHHVIGDVRSRKLLRQQITTGQVHPWVYAQVHLHGRELDRICATWDLWPHRIQPSK